MLTIIDLLSLFYDYSLFAFGKRPQENERFTAFGRVGETRDAVDAERCESERVGARERKLRIRETVVRERLRSRGRRRRRRRRRGVQQYQQSNGGRPEPDYAVGWEDGMEDTIGKCFEVAVVSRAYRSTPVVGLCVGTGLVAIGGNGSSSRDSEASRESVALAARARARKQAATMNKYGWYFPLEALEHI